MDPITHAVIGLGTAALSGQPVVLTNPIYIGAALGALAPDIDVATHVNPLSFLKHHRGMSHSLAGITFISLIIAIGLNYCFPAVDFFTCWLWTFLGAFSHSILDSLNSYGTQLWWPFLSKKWNASLLMLFDPYLLLLYLVILFGVPQRYLGSGVHILVLPGLYLLGRYWMRQTLAGHLRKTLNLCHETRVVVMPARYGFNRWDFVVDSPKEFILGKINYYGRSISDKINLVKENNAFFEQALASKVGRFFRSFTPHLHLEYRRERDKHIVFFRDLRYMERQMNFLHTATVVINDTYDITASYLHPYRQDVSYPVDHQLMVLAESLQGD